MLLILLAAKVSVVSADVVVIATTVSVLSVTIVLCCCCYYSAAVLVDWLWDRNTHLLVPYIYFSLLSIQYTTMNPFYLFVLYYLIRSGWRHVSDVARISRCC